MGYKIRGRRKEKGKWRWGTDKTGRKIIESDGVATIATVIWLFIDLAGTHRPPDRLAL